METKVSTALPDYPIDALYNTNCAIATEIVHFLYAIEDSTFCPAKLQHDKWNKDLQTMLEAFSILKRDDFFDDTKQTQRLIDRGLKLFQKYFRELPDYEGLAGEIAPLLQAHSLCTVACPYDLSGDEWHQILQAMIDAFTLLSYPHYDYNQEEEQTIENGLELFREHFESLWY